MIDGHGPTRTKRRPEAPGDGSHSCAASGPGLKRRRPTSLIRDIRDRASGGNQINEASHHQGTTPRDRTRRHPPDQPGCSCNPRPPVRSTPEVPYMQTDELTAAGCWRVWTEHASGTLDRRPALDEVRGQLRPGDTLVVWRLDRLGRSLRHLIEVVTALDERGVGFRSLREAIDTTTPGGRLVFHLFGALAQFEREIIRDRTMAGLAAARARGRSGGRRSKLDAEQRRTARTLYDERELTVAQIGQVLGVSRTSIYRALGQDAAARPGAAVPRTESTA